MTPTPTHFPPASDDLDLEARDLLFIGYLEDDLGPEERNEVRARLLSDPEFRREFDAFKAIMDATKKAILQPAPPDFVAEVQGRLRQRSRGYFFNPTGRWAPLEALSAAMIMLMAAAWLVTGTPHDHRLHRVDTHVAPQLHIHPRAHAAP